MYSLLSAPVLCFDLVRSPHGGQVAELLGGVMDLTSEDLARVGDGYSSGGTSGSDPGLEELSAALRRSRALMAQRDVAAALSVLERAPVAGLSAVHHAIRTDVLAWTARLAEPERARGGTLVELVCDAVADAHAGRASDAVRTLQQLLAPVPEPSDALGPCAAQVRELLARLDGLDPAGWTRVRRAAEQARRHDWARSMHSATWAVHLADRVRAAARAQLLAVGVLERSPLGLTDLAAGGWNLVSGAVQTLAVADLLDEETQGRLLDRLTGALAG